LKGEMSGVFRSPKTFKWNGKHQKKQDIKQFSSQVPGCHESYAPFLSYFMEIFLKSQSYPFIQVMLLTLHPYNMP
jgi:hypothetical protein